MNTDDGRDSFGMRTRAIPFQDNCEYNLSIQRGKGIYLSR
jgi:hypothetical protein